VHALVVGVGDYVRAEGATIGSIAGPVISALRFSEWLQSDFRPAGRELGTIRLLLSPTAQEQGVVDASRVEVHGRADRDTVAEELRAWANRCDASADDAALLYFAGHGTEAPLAGGHVLLDDFSPEEGLDRALDLRWLFDAMEYRAAGVNFFFVDACRAAIREQTDFVGQVGMRPIKVPQNAVPRRSRYKVLYGAANGYSAWTLPDADLLTDGTVFSWALRQALQRAAVGDYDGSLVVRCNRLSEEMALLVAAKLRELDQEYGGGEIRGAADGVGSIQEVAFHRPDSVPVELEIALTPEELALSTEATLYRAVDASNDRFDRQVLLDPHPARIVLQSGSYRLALKCPPPPPLGFDFSQRRFVVPGERLWTIEMQN